LREKDAVARGPSKNKKIEKGAKGSNNKMGGGNDEKATALCQKKQGDTGEKVTGQKTKGNRKQKPRE